MARYMQRCLQKLHGSRKWQRTRQQNEADDVDGPNHVFVDQTMVRMSEEQQEAIKEIKMGESRIELCICEICIFKRSLATGYTVIEEAIKVHMKDDDSLSWGGGGQRRKVASFVNG